MLTSDKPRPPSLPPSTRSSTPHPTCATLMHRVTRHPLTIGVFRALHPSVGFWIADKLSGKLADNTRDRAVLDRAARAQSQYAKAMLERRPDLDLVVLAHTHRPACEQLPDGRAYLNPGAFLDGYRYAIVTKDGIELKTFTGSGR